MILIEIVLRITPFLKDPMQYDHDDGKESITIFFSESRIDKYANQNSIESCFFTKVMFLCQHFL